MYGPSAIPQWCYGVPRSISSQLPVPGLSPLLGTALPKKLSPIEQTYESVVANIDVVGGALMSEVSVFTVERNAWSIARRCEMRFRLTYERGFLPVQNLWRDFLVCCDEIGPALPD